MNLDINFKTIITMEMIITKVMIDSVKETIKDDNTVCSVCKHILASIVKEAKNNNCVSVRKVKDLLSIQTELLTAFDEDIASEKLSKEQIEERIKILDVLQEMTKSLFTDALNALNKRLGELKDDREDDLSGLTKDELIDLIKDLTEEIKEEK